MKTNYKKLRTIILSVCFICVFVLSVSRLEDQGNITLPAHKTSITVISRLIDKYGDSANVKATADTKVNNYWNTLQIQHPNNSFMVYVGPAFYDKRITEDHHVKILVVSSRRLTYNKYSRVPSRKLYCHFFYKVGSNVEVIVSNVSAVFKMGLSLPLRDWEMFQNVLSCRPLKLNGTILPHQVSLSTSNYIFQAVQNITYPSEKYRDKLGVCVNSLYGNLVDKREAIRFIEWIEIYRYFGVKQLHMYNSTLNMTTPEFLKALDYYQNIGVITLTQMPPLVESYSIQEHHEVSQTINRIVHNHCFLTHMFSYEYIINLDMDDYLIPRSHTSYSELLSVLERNNTAKIERFVVQARHFPLDWGTGGSINRTSSLISSKYTKFNPTPYGVWQNKSISSAHFCDVVGIHNCFTCATRMKCYEPTRLPTVPESLALFHHYRKSCKGSYNSDPNIAENNNTEQRTAKRFIDKMLLKLEGCDYGSAHYTEDYYMLQFQDILTQKVEKVAREINLDIISY